MDSIHNAALSYHTSLLGVYFYGWNLRTVLSSELCDHKSNEAGALAVWEDQGDTAICGGDRQILLSRSKRVIHSSER